MTGLTQETGVVGILPLASGRLRRAHDRGEQLDSVRDGRREFGSGAGHAGIRLRN